MARKGEQFRSIPTYTRKCGSEQACVSFFSPEGKSNLYYLGKHRSIELYKEYVRYPNSKGIYCPLPISFLTAILPILSETGVE